MIRSPCRCKQPPHGWMSCPGDCINSQVHSGAFLLKVRELSASTSLQRNSSVAGFAAEGFVKISCVELANPLDQRRRARGSVDPVQSPHGEIYLLSEPAENLYAQSVDHAGWGHLVQPPVVGPRVGGRPVSGCQQDPNADGLLLMRPRMAMVESGNRRGNGMPAGLLAGKNGKGR